MKKYIVYVSIPKEKFIEVFKIKKNVVKKIQEVYTKREIQPLKISYKKKIIYAGIRNKPKIITYKIKKNGFLKKVKETKTFANPNHISLDIQEKYLFNSSYGGNCIVCHELNKQGFPKKKYRTKKKIYGCHSSIFHSFSKTLFFTSLKLDKIFFEKVNNLQKIFKKKLFYLKSEKNSGPRHMEIHPNQKYLYVLNELNNTISIWNINKILNKKVTHPIQIINTFPEFHGKKWAADIHISPCGSFLYTSERTSNSISLFLINKKKGILKLIKTYETEIQPRSFNIDPTGKRLIVSGQKSNSISIYKIDKNLGLLKKITSFPTRKEPLWIEIF
jgi:6-phosphogluconolactonase